MTVFEAALKYLARGYSIIPVRPDKKPYLAWERYQKIRMTPEEATACWKRWPDAGVGIITGQISGIVVIDVDNTDQTKIHELLPENLRCPAVATPSGGYHLYFKNPPSLMPNNTGVVPGCDFRGEGGYVVVPPSKGYSWLPESDIFSTPLPDLPVSYIDFISKGRGNTQAENPQEKPENAAKPSGEGFLKEGNRDNTLFHVANLMVKGGAAEEEVIKVLDVLAKSASPPFPTKEIYLKAQSALKRAADREINMAKEVREWVTLHPGQFLIADILRDLELITKPDKHNLSMVLHRLQAEGLIERAGNRRGGFRLIERECDKIDYTIKESVIDIKWPMRVEEWVLTMPKNIVVIAGEFNAGKTAFLLNTARMNMKHFVIHYFSSEMAATELGLRLSKFPEPLDYWSVDFRERATMFSDVIYPDDINIIDYLEVSEDFFRVGGMLREMYEKLRNGIALVALQKNPGTDWGIGGARGLEKPRLYLSMEPGKLKIVKGKNWASETNPNGLSIRFKLIQGATFVTEETWVREGRN